MKTQTIPTLEQAYSGTLFGSAALQQDGVSVIEIDPKELIEIEDQPFAPYPPEKLAELAESIQNNGQMTPCNVRRKDGKYYILAGRNRKRACELAGIKVRCIVEEYDDASADLVLTDTNLYQRRQLSPSELAFAFQMQKQAYMKKGGKKSTRAIADAQGQDVRTVQRYLKLTELNHGLLELVDQGRIPVAAGAELTKLSEENQEALLQYLSDNPEQGVKDKDLPLLLEEGQTGNFDSSLAQIFQRAPKAKREKKASQPRKEQEPVEETEPTGKELPAGSVASLLETWEQEAYQGGYGSDWLEEIGENVRFYTMECEHDGKKPTFDGLIQHLKVLHDRGTKQCTEEN